MPPPLAVNVAVIHEGRILLTLREDFEVWCLPGGHLEDRESLAQAAVRETREETGLEVRLTRLVGLYQRPNFGGYHTLAVFAAVPVGGTLTPQPGEVLDLRFFGPEEIPEDLLLGQAERIRDAVSGAEGLVYATPLPRPPSWPASREALYAARDASGLSPRAAFYRRLVGNLPGQSMREVPGPLAAASSAPSSAPPAGAWTCPRCREALAASFDSCWHCGTTREGKANPGFVPVVTFAPECRGCGYNLTGLAEHGIYRCPECAKRFDPVRDVDTPSDPPP